MRRRAFESPDLALCFEYIHHGCRKLRKFFTDLQRSGSHFFSARLSQSIKIQKFLGVKKLNFGGQNDSKKNFSLNVSKVFGT